MYIFGNFSDELHFLFEFFTIYLDEKNSNSWDKNFVLHSNNIQFCAVLYPYFSYFFSDKSQFFIHCFQF